MSQSSQLINALKAYLKVQGITYAALAGKIKLSEASVKRLFAEQSFSIKRLEQICQAVGLEITDLVDMVRSRRHFITELSEEQEQALVKDVRLLLIAQLLLNKWTLDDILRSFEFEETEAIRLLAKLDRLNFIQLQPNNSVKLLTERNFTWRKDGPVQEFFRDKVYSEFFKTDFTKPREALIFVTGMLADSSYKQFLHKIARTAKEFDELCHQDAKLPLSERFGYSAVFAVRPWELPVFNRFRRTAVKGDRRSGE